MSLILQDPQVEALAHRLAAAQGITVEQAVRRSLEAAAARTGLESARSLDEALTELRRWAEHRIHRDPNDTQTVDELLGYDESGAW